MKYLIIFILLSFSAFAGSFPLAKEIHNSTLESIKQLRQVKKESEVHEINSSIKSSSDNGYFDIVFSDTLDDTITKEFIQSVVKDLIDKGYKVESNFRDKYFNLDIKW